MGDNVSLVGNSQEPVGDGEMLSLMEDNLTHCIYKISLYP